MEQLILYLIPRSNSLNGVPHMNLPEGFISKILAKDQDSGYFVEIQEIAPESYFTEHRHTSDEWVYILEGQLEDEFGTYPAGTFKINTKDSIHAPRSEQGCKLIVFRKGDYVAVK